ncbi:MAG: type I DNA topoisomerase [Candidatus Infernicultor aquiphilus]|uniref:DNA topoisomerase 1 n=1 Tax=Candidatus Infernicultor aquiphilus TaxID=1805029 RepID=A0A1J5GG74_9BACT|nr:type I DNA topoisomerase [bacterium]OIP71276.1 MAG: DNA topoisomerase I [Candidatus Atribacteria bacterium CG2_30_33_13]PIU24900.1 MAG: type I DNA topoisomerase [Candidatus Atribacteria bacterium CG08_land_8_20_14_0_20_33_29]PIW12392.1 MAG: type I DNA topoisomerase [Candidatus Atribacteria bacterium CG17_big_fil_post_rev_8_21_14_2_50_34_11]PIX33788.1 MAG: type I DNA topoisomerase [Candidatus Atribacteria bacterium CG_4_8_14_3_um_filter_34_18]PIY33697.1 MAG: type I DNA topoisomerase [Candida
MVKYLVIVESPTKEKTLKKILGENYLIKSSKGHIIDLPKTKLGIDIGNDFQPEYVTIPRQRSIVKELEKYSKDKDKIFLATDPDREGEAIAWHIAQKLKIKNDNNRVSFNEITERAVSQAFKNPREINLNMVDSQKTRRLLDRLVGYKISPLLWKKIGKKLSAGRVQSVTLRLICEREEEILKFKEDEYWLISVLLNKTEDEEIKPFEAKLFSVDSKKITIRNKKEAMQICEEVKNQNIYVKDINKRKEFKNPQPSFTTSSLQQEGYNKLNFSIKKSMIIAQQLYEGIALGDKGNVGLITYMRTDSIRVSNEAKSEAKKYIEEKYGKKFAKSFENFEKDKKKIKNKTIQDAHESIRPTSVFNQPDLIKKYLSNDQYKLYSLIWQRFIASRMKAAYLEKITINIEAGKYLFRASGSNILFKGFMIIYNEDNQDLNKPPDLKEGDKLKIIKIEEKQYFTKPPPRYTEASLVKTLEKEGIGRPSTYVPIIDTIQRREYVEKVNKKFNPTELGIKVNSFLTQYFSDIINVAFTAKMEKQLDEVESNKKKWVDILKTFYKTFSKDLEKGNQAQRIKITQLFSDEICDKCGRKMLIKSGRFGKFLACSGFPDCKNTKSFLDKIGINCPEEGCPGEIVRKKTKKGRIFYGCSNYPKCSFMTWNKPVDKKCPKCNSILVLDKNKKNGFYYKCSNSVCDYKDIIKEDKE